MIQVDTRCRCGCWWLLLMHTWSLRTLRPHGTAMHPCGSWAPSMPRMHIQPLTNNGRGPPRWALEARVGTDRAGGWVVCAGRAIGADAAWGFVHAGRAHLEVGAECAGAPALECDQRLAEVGAIAVVHTSFPGDVAGCRCVAAVVHPQAAQRAPARLASGVELQGARRGARIAQRGLAWQALAAAAAAAARPAPHVCQRLRRQVVGGRAPGAAVQPVVPRRESRPPG